MKFPFPSFFRKWSKSSTKSESKSSSTSQSSKIEAKSSKTSQSSSMFSSEDDMCLIESLALIENALTVARAQLDAAKAAKSGSITSSPSSLIGSPIGNMIPIATKSAGKVQFIHLPSNGDLDRSGVLAKSKGGSVKKTKKSKSNQKKGYGLSLFFGQKRQRVVQFETTVEVVCRRSSFRVPLPLPRDDISDNDDSSSADEFDEEYNTNNSSSMSDNDNESSSTADELGELDLEEDETWYDSSEEEYFDEEEGMWL